MSDITSAVLKLAIRLNGGFEPKVHDDYEEGDVHIRVPCPIHVVETGDEYCVAYMNRYRVEHHWDGEWDATSETTFEEFAEAVEEAENPWTNTEGLRAEREAEGKLDWVWEGMLLPGNITLLCAAPKAGKTTLVFDAIEGTLSNKGMLGLAAHSAEVLYFTEESPDAILTRIEEMNSPVMTINPRLHWRTRKPGLTWATTLESIGRFASRYPRTLVVIDTMAFWMEIDDENDAVQFRKALQPLVDIVRNTNVAVLLVHHSRKEGGADGSGCRGSTALTGTVDIILSLNRDDRGLGKEDHQWNPKRRLDTLSRYSATPDSMTLIWERGGRYRVADMASLMNLGAARDERRYGENTVRAVLDLAGDGMGTRKIAEEVGETRDVVRGILKRHGE